MFANNLLPFILAVTPVFLYMFLIHSFVPKDYIVPRRAKRYFVIGLLSTTLITMLHYVFPNMREMNSGILFFCIFQIGIPEELTKFITYKWTTSQRKSHHEDLPIATMYYVMLCSAGFAIIENIHYLIFYGSDVVFSRAITAIVLHLICGIIMGYYIAKSKSMKFTFLEELSKDYVRIAKSLMVAFGIVMAAILHGIYDYNLSLQMNFYAEFMMYMFIVGGLVISFFMIKELIRESKEIKATHDAAPKKLSGKS